MRGDEAAGAVGDGAVGDIEHAVSFVADLDVAGTGPGRSVAAEGYLAGGMLFVADVADRIADGSAICDLQRAVAEVANVKVLGVGLGRPCAADRHHTGGAGIVADVAPYTGDSGAIVDVQCP